MNLVAFGPSVGVCEVKFIGRTHHGIRGNARNEPANGGREARGGAARQLETNEMASLGRNQDGHQSHTSTAGLTAPVRLNADKYTGRERQRVKDLPAALKLLVDPPHACYSAQDDSLR